MTPDAALKLAIAHQQAGRLAEAENIYRQILHRDPSHADALHLLGLIAHACGKADEAIELISRAIQRRPDVAMFHNNLGAAYASAGRYDLAVAAFERALALAPDLPQARYNLANALREADLHDRAVTEYRGVLSREPDHAFAHNNLALTLQAQGLIDEAIAEYRHAIRIDPAYTDAHSNLLFALNLHPDLDAAAILAEHRTFEATHGRPEWRAATHSNDRSPDRPLRIGYVSPDFRAHPIGRFCLPFLRQRDRNQFHITCYSDVRRADEMTAEIRRLADAWRDCAALSHDQLAEAIRGDAIDILVDLACHCADNRMPTFLRKPAPVQVTFLGYPGTTGLSTIDYRISDTRLDPPGVDAHYSERTIRLPGCYWCFTAPADAPDVAPPPSLANGYVTFGCLNNPAKVSEPALRCFATVLAEMPNARLMLQSAGGSAADRIRNVFAAAGVGADRLALVGRQSRADYLATFARIDIALDPLPYNGHTTTFDALWMGAPVVTLRGRTAVGRAGDSILTTLGHGAWVAASVEQYVRIAVDLARDGAALCALRATLREKMSRSGLMDAAAYTRGLELAFRRMWRAFCDGSSASAGGRS